MTYIDSRTVDPPDIPVCFPCSTRGCWNYAEEADSKCIECLENERLWGSYPPEDYEAARADWIGRPEDEGR